MATNNFSPPAGKPGESPQRTMFTKEKLEILQRYFEVNSKPSYDEEEAIAEEIGVKCIVVHTWFNNARSRLVDGDRMTTFMNKLQWI